MSLLKNVVPFRQALNTRAVHNPIISPTHNPYRWPCFVHTALLCLQDCDYVCSSSGSRVSFPSYTFSIFPSWMCQTRYTYYTRIDISSFLPPFFSPNGLQLISFQLLCVCCLTFDAAAPPSPPPPSPPGFFSGFCFGNSTVLNSMLSMEQSTTCSDRALRCNLACAHAC